MPIPENGRSNRTAMTAVTAAPTTKDAPTNVLVIMNRGRRLHDFFEASVIVDIGFSGSFGRRTPAMTEGEW